MAVICASLETLTFQVGKDVFVNEADAQAHTDGGSAHATPSAL